MYVHGQRPLAIGTALTPIATQGPGIKGPNTCFIMFRPVLINGIAAQITTAVTVTAAVLEVIYRPTPGSATGQTVLGTITLPTAGSAIGQQVFKKFAPFKALPGGEVVLNLTVASTAGAAVFGLLVSETTEAAGNVPAMIESV